MLRRQIVLLVFGLASGAGAATPATTVTSGVGIGMNRLGTSREAIRKVFGKPSRSFETHFGCSADQWDAGDGSQFEAVYQSGPAVQLQNSSRRFVTRSGLSTGSRFARIRHIYPELKRTTYLKDGESGKGLDYYDEIRRGVAFAFTTPTAAKRDEESPWIILVHQPGHPAIPTAVSDPQNTVTVSPRKRNTGARGAAVGASCQAFVQQFYDRYVKLTASEHSGPICDHEIKARPALFSSELRRRLAQDSAAQARAHGEIVGIDFDPFLNASDPADRYVVRKVVRKGRSYYADVHGMRDGKPGNTPDVIAKLVPRGRTWTFVNFLYPAADNRSRKSDLLTVLAQNRESRARRKR